MTAKPKLQPGLLKDAPALIEHVFPAQKVSYEARQEREAGRGQTLPSIGSYWKGRKPLIQVRAIVLGSLLPSTGDHQRDLDLFERLMGFDAEGLARRALVANKLKPTEIASRISLSDPWDYFTFAGQGKLPPDDPSWSWEFPLEADDLRLRWRRDLDDDGKLEIIRKVLATFATYEEKAELCKRPEEVDEAWLYAPVWPVVNRAYADLGISAQNFAELVEQLGILRYGHRPRVGDTFSGGGSIPFEAARLGCDVYASDLNPIACMLTWGALNIVGASPERREEIEAAQREVAAAVDAEIVELGIEHDAHGNRAKAYLYCLETRCPETGWMVPLIQNLVISTKQKIVAKLTPDYDRKRFNIDIVENATKAEMVDAARGTVDDDDLVYELDGRSYRTPIKTLRGDYRQEDGSTGNRLRLWTKEDFKPRPEDIFQERLYAIQWITAETLNDGRQETFFASVTEEDLQREAKVEVIVAENLARWQEEGLVPDMAIEPGAKTEEPIRTRGWTHWHHLFNPRNILLLTLLMKRNSTAETALIHCGQLDWNSKKTRWDRVSLTALNSFTRQTLDTHTDWMTRASFVFCHSRNMTLRDREVAHTDQRIVSVSANDLVTDSDLWITDPPYADAVMYHEIYEFFIAWLRKNPPPPFDEWVWDSRRALAIKGSGDDFRRGMVDAYRAMANHMPENGLQCVMFTHQDSGVWADLVGIFWAAGLQVVAAWYIATETSSALKKGGHVQGTVTLMLRKRADGERTGFKQQILPAVRREVERQIGEMLNLNEEIADTHGEPVFNDSDLQMAGYAAAMKVLTAYTKIGSEDVTSFALRPRQKGEVTVVDEIVQQAAEAANSLLVPEGLQKDSWARLSGIQRFILRMMDMETTGAAKLDNYQNFAKAFRVEDYAAVMGSMKANDARLKYLREFASRDLSDRTELGNTWLGQLIIALQQVAAETDPQIVLHQLQGGIPDYLEARPILIDMLAFMARNLRDENAEQQQAARDAADVLGARMKNQRALGQ